MTFDEELDQELATLADRLRDSLTNQLRGTLVEWAETARASRDHGLAEARTAGVRDAAARAAAASDRLADSVRTLDRARSLSETLDTLAACAAREMPRVALFLPTPEGFRGWRSIGFLHDFDAVHPLDVPPSDAALVREATETAAIVTGRAAVSPASFAGNLPHSQSLAAPIMIGGEVCAVLYADAGPEPAGADEWPAVRGRLEILARHAARCLESIVARGAAGFVPARRPQAAARVDEAAGAHEDEAAAARYAKLPT